MLLSFRAGPGVLLILSIFCVPLGASDLQGITSVLQAEEDRSLLLTQLVFHEGEFLRADRWDLHAPGHHWGEASLTDLVFDSSHLGFGLSQIRTPSTQKDVAWHESQINLGWTRLTFALGDWDWTLGAIGTMATDGVFLLPRQGHVGIEIDPGVVWSTTVEYESWTLTGATGHLNGALLFPLSDQVGQVQLQAEGLVLGWQSGGAGLLHFRGELESFYHVLSLIPYASRGNLDGIVLGTWLNLESSQGTWRVGMLSASALTWAFQGSYRTYREVVSFQPTFPFIIKGTKEARYDLSWNPAWSVVLKPRLSWSPQPGWTIEIARWLLFSGGWDIQTRDVSGSHSPRALRVSHSQESWRHWWLDGLEAGVRASF